MITNEQIVATLEKLREENHRTIQYITNGIISNRHYTRLLNGEAVINMDDLGKMLDRINIPFDDFIEYIHIKNKIEYYDEEYVIVLVMYENYKKALIRLKNIPSPSDTHSIFGLKAFPAALACLDYYQKKIGLEALREYLKSLINFNEIEKNKIIHDYDIYTMYMYVKIASDEERNRLIDFLKRYIYQKEFKLFALEYEIVRNVTYATILYALTNKEKVTKKDDELIHDLAHKIISFNAKSKLTPYCTIIFEILYKYAKKYETTKEEYIVFYYIAGIVATSNNDFLRGRTFEITSNDIEIYNKMMNDDKFVRSLMYKKVLHG